MLKRIVLTFLSRIAATALSFLVVVLTARYLGPEGRGEITLITLSITINLLVSSLLGTGAIVYLSPRYHLQQLLIIAQIWGVIAAFCTTIALVALGILATQYYFDVFLLSVFFVFFSNNQTILQGYQKIKQYNSLNLIHLTILTVCFIAYIGFWQQTTIIGYIYCLYISYTCGTLASFYYVYQLSNNSVKQPYTLIIKKIIYHGGFMVLANTAQLLNYRFSYYIIEKNEGLAQLGIFSIVVALSEGLWLITKSISVVQYAQVSNSESQTENMKLTMKYIRISLCATVTASIILMCIPDSIFTLIFGDAFYSLKPTILLFMPGIVGLSVSNIIGHYFSGIGKHFLSTISTTISLVFTISLNLLLIPIYGISGAAFAASCSYIAAMLFWLVIWHNAYPFKLKEFILLKSDFKL